MLTIHTIINHNIKLKLKIGIFKINFSTKYEKPTNKFNG